jgi:hypothetical protein
VAMPSSLESVVLGRAGRGEWLLRMGAGFLQPDLPGFARLCPRMSAFCIGGFFLVVPSLGRAGARIRWCMVSFWRTGRGIAKRSRAAFFLVLF